MPGTPLQVEPQPDPRLQRLLSPRARATRPHKQALSLECELCWRDQGAGRDEWVRGAGPHSGLGRLF